MEEEEIESQKYHQALVDEFINKNNFIAFKKLFNTKSIKKPKKSKNHQELFSEYDYINNSQNKSGEYVNNNFDNKGKDAQLFTNKINVGG